MQTSTSYRGKIVCILIGMIVAIAAPAKLSAQIQFFGRGLAFNLIEGDSLYPEYAADPFSLSSGLKYLRVLDLGSMPSTVLAKSNGKYVQIPFIKYDENNIEGQNRLWQIKGFVNLSLARMNYGEIIKTEISAAGGLDAVFQAFGALDTYGFDGIWRIAIAARLFDAVSLRYGSHHFSGHWGDEAVENLPKPGDSDYLAYSSLAEYVRISSHVFGISIDPISWMRLYFEAELPMDDSYISPSVHQTAQYKDFSDEIPDYRAWRLQTGAELKWPLRDWGSFFLAGDFQFHQDGQTMHQTGKYSPDNPWEFEYTVGGGFEYGKGFVGRKIRIEVFYHDGRFPLVNYFFQRSKYVSLGLAINN